MKGGKRERGRNKRRRGMIKRRKIREEGETEYIVREGGGRERRGKEGEREEGGWWKRQRWDKEGSVGGARKRGIIEKDKEREGTVL